jgi:hypothetical protein
MYIEDISNKKISDCSMFLREVAQACINCQPLKTKPEVPAGVAPQIPELNNSSHNCHPSIDSLHLLRRTNYGVSILREFRHHTLCSDPLCLAQRPERFYDDPLFPRGPLRRVFTFGAEDLLQKPVSSTA